MARTQRIDMAAKLARQLGWTAHFKANLLKHDGGEYGNALLTDLPVLDCKNTLLPQVRPTEPRGLLQATLLFQGREIEVLTTHLDAGRRDDERCLQAVAVLAVLSKLPVTRPFVLCGDFNDTSQGPAYALLARELLDVWANLHPDTDVYTIPAHKPQSRIDFFWVAATGPQPTQTEVLSGEASDHLPIVAEFELPLSVPDCRVCRNSVNGMSPPASPQPAGFVEYSDSADMKA